MESLQTDSSQSLRSQQDKSREFQVKIDTLTSRLESESGKVSDLKAQNQSLQEKFQEQCQSTDTLKAQLSEAKGNISESQRLKSNL